MTAAVDEYLRRKMPRGTAPGEAREADLGIAGGDGVGLLIRQGKIIKKVPEADLLGVLREELLHWDQEGESEE